MREFSDKFPTDLESERFWVLSAGLHTFVVYRFLDEIFARQRRGPVTSYFLRDFLIRRVLSLIMALSRSTLATL